VQVGNEFSSVEALWSQFENVMAKDPDADDQVPEDEEGEERNTEDETVLGPEYGTGR
jgi:DASH complex subunit DAD1